MWLKKLTPAKSLFAGAQTVSRHMPFIRRVRVRETTALHKAFYQSADKIGEMSNIGKMRIIRKVRRED